MALHDLSELDALILDHTTGVTHSPEYVNVIFETAHAAALAWTDA
jgi:hypothetical protein